MSLLEWKPQFAVGIPSVDHEHRELISLINELHAEMIAGGSHDRMDEFAGELSARISAHFALEEKVMVEARYDQYTEHKADHEALLDQLAYIMDEIDAQAGDDAKIDDRLAERLDAWFAVHFRTHDARLHHQIG